jgi:dGTP triphosphohydrolase
MISWTKDALDALATGIYGERQTYEPDKLRAALDSAVRAQKEHPSGIRDITDYMDGMAEGYADGRAEALEKAAKVAESFVSTDDSWDHSYWDQACNMIANRLRALMDKPANQTGD